MGTRSDKTFKFTKDALEGLQTPAEGESIYYDSDCRGLVVRVWPTGRKTFAFYGRVGPKVVRHVIGPVEEFSVARARAEAAHVRADKESGRDTKREAIRAAEAGGAGPTLRVVFARYVRDVRGKLRTWRELVAMFGKHVKPTARVPIVSVDEEWLRTLHRRITSGGHPGAANRVLSLMSAVLSFHLGEGKPNPAAAIKRNPETERHRTLTEEEERKFLRAIDAYEAEPAGVPGSKPLDPDKFKAKQRAAQAAKRTAADLLRLLYWTGQRAGNVRAMEWAAVDLKARTWTIAARHFKGGKPHVAALPDEAVEILKLRKAAAGSDAVYVFPAGNAKSARGYFVNYHNAFHRVKELAGIDAGKGLHRDDTLRAHDLRAGLATAMANVGENAFAIQR
ncbi:MAG: integrase family protein, partial [Dehalococcoidia bacterium]